MHHSTAQAELEDHIAEDLASLLQLEMHPCCQAPGSGLEQPGAGCPYTIYVTCSTSYMNYRMGPF